MKSAPAAPAVQVIRGVATLPDGEALAGATLYLLDLPGSQFLEKRGAGNRVVTNAKGEFRWVVPAALAHNVIIKDEGEALSCYALPQDANWTAEVALARQQARDSDTRTLLEKAALRCQTRWTKAPDGPRMSVVAPARGRVDLQLRAPDGAPLAARAVELVVPDRGSNYAGALIYRGRTDDKGQLKWHGFPGLKRLLISVPGVGFGATGSFELLADKIASPAVPLLAPFASIAGMVPPELLAPDLIVRAQSPDGDDRLWPVPQAKVGDDGSFKIEGLLPGRTVLQLSGDKPNERVWVSLVPGETKTQIALKPRAPAPEMDAQLEKIARRMSGANRDDKSTVSGRVTDVWGAPVAGAEVYALNSYNGGIRSYEQIVKTTTQTDGTYTLTDLKGAPKQAALVAVRAGYPLAFATAQEQNAQPDDENVESRELNADLVFSSGHPALRVRVLRAGQPLKGAWVALSPQSGTGLFSRFYVGSAREPESKELRKLLRPTARTDEGGEAIFSDLTPGLWDVTATAGDENSLDSVGSWFGNQAKQQLYNIARGAAVGARERAEVALGVFEQTGAVTLQLRTADGRAPKNSDVAVQYGLAALGTQSSTSFKVDADGEGQFSLQSSGLWTLNARWRDGATASFPATTEPFYEASTLLAIAPSLPRNEPVELTATRRGPGRIAVRLLDENGRPAAGAVWIEDTFDGVQYGASVRPDAPTVLPDMPSGIYQLKAAFADYDEPPAFGSESAKFPSDAELLKRRNLMSQAVTVQSDQTTTVTFGPQTQGYVRGVIRGVADPADYTVIVPFYSETPINVGYDPKTGEFVAGPFAPGKTMLNVMRVQPELDKRGENFPVVVKSSHVERVEFVVGQAPPSARAAETSILTMGGVFHANGANSPPATVYLPDGTTPAWGAQGAVFVPTTWQAVRSARADALGVLSPTSSWYSDQTPADPPPGSPTQPTLVAWLPGANGAAIVPLEDAAKAPLILPAAASIRGRITLAGKTVSGVNSSFIVRAAYQGRGKLNALLSVEATAQADGSFELAGLTPGTYRVQAARDGIWLSESRQITVEGGTSRLDFDIKGAGAPTILRLSDADRQPLAGQTLILMRPPGPLTERLWPESVTTDAKGAVRLEGLEAGAHQLKLKRANGESRAFAVTIAPLVAGQKAQTETVVLPATAIR